MKIRGGGGRGKSMSPGPNGRKAGRPEGEVSYSGSGMMTKYSKPNTSGGLTMKLSGRAGRSNGVKNLAGRSTAKNYTGDPNVRRKSN